MGGGGLLPRRIYSDWDIYNNYEKFLINGFRTLTARVSHNAIHGTYDTLVAVCRYTNLGISWFIILRLTSPVRNAYPAGGWAAKKLTAPPHYGVIICLNDDCDHHLVSSVDIHNSPAIITPPIGHPLWSGHVTSDWLPGTTAWPIIKLDTTSLSMRRSYITITAVIENIQKLPLTRKRNRSFFTMNIGIDTNRRYI